MVIIPQDIIDEISDHIAVDTDLSGTLQPGALKSLRACSLVSKSWTRSSRRHLFRTVVFASKYMDRWLEMFPVLEDSPARHVRELRIWTGGTDCVPEDLFQHTHWFSNVEKMSLIGYGGTPPLRRPSLWRLPQSITFLFVNTNAITLLQLRDIMAQLPNVDDLTLLGFLAPADRTGLLGIGSVLRGNFGGKLSLCSEYEHDPKDLVDMLLEIPTGLHFTEAWIYYRREYLPSTLRLVGACCKTLVKLSHKVASHGKSPQSDRP